MAPIVHRREAQVSFFSDMESSGIVDVIANVDWNVKVKL
jgi:hypothetical protein